VRTLTVRNKSDDNTDRLRVWLTFGIAVIGIGVVLLAFLIAVLTLRHAKQPGELIPAVVGVVTAAVRTLAGLVAGHTAGAAGKERAERRADAREQEAAAGRTLAETLKTEDALLPQEGGAAEGLTAAGEQPQVEVIRRHAELHGRYSPSPGVRPAPLMFSCRD
jgi:hypothetical protein